MTITLDQIIKYHILSTQKNVYPDLLKEFYATKNRQNADWEGSITASDLYNVWDKKLFEHQNQNQNKLQPIIDCEANKSQSITLLILQANYKQLSTRSPNSNLTETNLISNSSILVIHKIMIVMTRACNFY